MYEKHRHQEWPGFRNLIWRNAPVDKAIHIICDTYATHQHEKVNAWFARNPRFHVHCTPTSASWLNLVERFFRDLTTRSLRRGVFRNVDDLISSIEAHIIVHNDKTKAFIWTAKASDIREKVKRGRRSLDNMCSEWRTTLRRDCFTGASQRPWVF